MDAQNHDAELQRWDLSTNPLLTLPAMIHHKRTIDERRADVIDTMEEWLEPPLWVMIERYADTIDSNNKTASKPGSSDNVISLHLTFNRRLDHVLLTLDLLFLLLHDTNHRTAFLISLSALQHHSLSILLEWLDATYQSPDKITNLIALIAIHSIYSLPKSLWQREKDNELGDKQYGNTLFTLFNFEFTYVLKVSRTKGVFPMDLNAARNMASAQSYVQLIGSCCLASSAKEVDTAHALVSTTPRNYVRIPTIFQKSRQVIESYWMMKLSEVETASSKPKSKEEAIRMSLALLPVARDFDPFYKGRAQPGPLKLFAPWLPSSDRRGHPYYLWDTISSRTVCFPDQPVRYIAISHTWGRWRPEDEACIEVSGVPWPVPVNTRFAVSNIPEILLSCSEALDCQFVWFDLVCIPQARPFGEVDDTWVSIKRREIKRQARIFTSATKVVAWFPDISNFEGLTMLSKYMALNCLKGPQTETDLYETILDNAWKITQDQQIEWYTEPKQQSNEINAFNGWFTSLWTLQEVSLRPDMMFSTADWKILSLNSTDPLRIDGLVAIFRSSMGRKNPISFRALSTLLAIAGLTDIFRLTPLGILSNGERRQCQSNRAEAIMSVIGTTTWYEENPDSAFEEQEMMLGKYPSKFVQEIRLKMGAPFFLANWYDGGYFGGLVDHTVNTKGLQPMGSMLPFGRELLAKSVSIPMIFNSCQEGHESVETWTLFSDGRVHISKAVVLASNNTSAVVTNFPDLKIHARVYFEDSKDGDPVALLDLHTWINDQSISYVAVVITYDSRAYNLGLWRHVHGVILRCVRDNYFVKFATFAYKGWDHKLPNMPVASNVDWIVL